MCPDAYRLGLTPDETTDLAAAEFERLLSSREVPPAAFIVESLICCGGQVDTHTHTHTRPPLLPGYLYVCTCTFRCMCVYMYACVHADSVCVCVCVCVCV
jgi:hypothetical protein